MKKSQKKFFIGALVVVSAIGYLMYAGIQETSVYYLTVTEAQGMATSREDLRIEGTVVAGTIERAPDALGAKFQITDQSNVVSIDYHGTIPDMFADDIDVVVQGRFEQGVFKAHTLLTSCPSKYEASEEGKV